ncbi:hypothetical protein MUO32_05130 [Shinella sp. CPCC 101442]|uniref:hypothetical protein n=1 Tax=Shinella sp. CPCC 101442 TaxID=2932265 RepID=UPI0021531A62|nr:hypothetical protein [Shinella sp. CPCC 101442]MCR6498410.1 hypothetical protein [Shinella sp. CPCC 101442]
MAFIGLPTVDIDFLAPERVPVDVRGAALEGGRPIAGEPAASELSGGGLISASYESCRITTEEQHEYVNMLSARLNGSFRLINVPIPTDWWGPFPKIGGLSAPYLTGIPHSDGGLFSDGAGYSQATVWGEVSTDASLNAGVLSLTTTGLSRRLRHSDWFSIYHPTKGWRAYRYWEVISAPSSTNGTYTLAINPPLREAVTAETRVEFARPRFVGRFPADFTLPSVTEAFFSIKQDMRFVEA